MGNGSENDSSNLLEDDRHRVPAHDAHMACHGTCRDHHTYLFPGCGDTLYPPLGNEKVIWNEKGTLSENRNDVQSDPHHDHFCWVMWLLHGEANGIEVGWVSLTIRP